MPLTKDKVLAFLRDNPARASRREITRGLGVKGADRALLRAIMKELERDGAVYKIGKGGYAQGDILPPTGLVRFDQTDAEGALWGRVLGKDKVPIGPPVRYVGYATKARGRPPSKGDKAVARFKQHRTGVWTAYLIRLIGQDRAAADFLAVFARGGRGAGILTPASKKDRRQYQVSPAGVAGAEEGDLVRARVLSTRRELALPTAEILEVLGRAKDSHLISRIAIEEHEIPHEFPKDVIEQAQRSTPQPCALEDWRSVPLITIDPADARDHDDAVYAEALDDGGWRVVVAIADVAAFVPSGSPLDREALLRGNSTYFPDRVVPMLPFALSAGDCSLKQGEERRTLGVEMWFNADGQKTKHRFFRGLMRSAAGLSYEDTQAAIDGDSHASDLAKTLLEPVLKPLWGAYAAMTAARIKRGPLELDLPERVIKLNEAGEVAKIHPKTRLDAHKLIEEMMIAANVAAAEALEQANTSLLYRVHDRPSDDTLANFSGFLKTIKLKFEVGNAPSPRQFNALLAETKGGDIQAAVSESVLRCQTKAVYSPQNLGHFGLALKRYAHFTSPIRRYADLVVHRALVRALGLGEDGLRDGDITTLEDTATHISATERRSMAAERDTIDRFVASYLDGISASVELAGTITGATKAGLFVRLMETGADGFIPIARLSSRQYVQYLEQARALVFENSNKGYQIGQNVDVRLSEVTPLKGGIILSMVSRPIKLNVKGLDKPSQRSDRRPKRRTRTRC